MNNVEISSQYLRAACPNDASFFEDVVALCKFHQGADILVYNNQGKTGPLDNVETLPDFCA